MNEDKPEVDASGLELTEEDLRQQRENLEILFDEGMGALLEHIGEKEQ